MPSARPGGATPLANLALSLATTLVLLGVLEGGARLLEGERPRRPAVADYIWDWDVKMPGGFYVVKTSAAGWPPWEEWSRDGLRDRTRTSERPEWHSRIAFLGDSVTFGADIRKEEAYPQRLEQRFRAEGRRVEVMNVALAGWSTRQQRIAWQRIVRGYRPDQAVLAVCLNDIPELFNNLARAPRWLTGLHQRSSLVRLLVRAEEREVDSVERLFLEPDSARVRGALERFFEEVQAMRREVEADGARFALVVFPFRFQILPGAPGPVVQEHIAAFCTREGIPCLDLLPAIRRAGPSVFRDYDHLSPAGAEYVAETLHDSGLLVLPEPRDVLGDALGERRGDLASLAQALATHGSAAVRAESAAALGASGPSARQVVPSLLAALADPSEFVRASAARALDRIGLAADDVPGLASALASPDAYVAAFAAWTLGNMGASAQAAVPALARANARDDTNAVVSAALARIGPAAAAAVPTLAAELRSSSDDRRWRAARTLGRIGPGAAPAVPQLAAALADANALVRMHAARALGRIGPAARSAAPALQRTTGDASPEVQSAAREALDLLH